MQIPILHQFKQGTWLSLANSSNSSIRSCMWGPWDLLGSWLCLWAVVSKTRAMTTFPQACTQSVSFLSAAECCLLFLYRAQALPLSPSLAVLAAASHSPSAQCCCLDFLMSKQNHCFCFNKITLVVFAPACSLHASLSRLLQLNPPPLLVPSYLDFQHIYQSDFQSSLLALHLLLPSNAISVLLCLLFATTPSFTSVSLPCVTSWEVVKTNEKFWDILSREV